MSTIKFDHSKETIREAMGFSNDFENEHAEKCANLAASLVSGNLKTSSELAEKIMETFSYNELVFTSTMYILNVIKNAQNNPLFNIISMLEELSKENEE